MTDTSTKPGPHILPLKVYLTVGVALLFMTVLTVTVSQIPLGGWNLVAALTIASIKALLVVFFFMHLYYDRKLYFFIFMVSIVVLTIFIVFTMFDTLERGAVYEIKAGPINPKATIYNEPMFKGKGASATDTSSKGAIPMRDSTKTKPDSTTHSDTSGIDR
jgi:cytochrome c oxidase subunit IV